jgi:tetratricopeptide (TPR) repeat protein
MENKNEYLSQAIVLASSNQLNEALVYFDKAEKEEPLNIEVYINRGVAFSNLERYKDAKEQFLKAQKINNTDGRVYYHLGSIAAVDGDLPGCLDLYKKAIANGFRDSQIYYNTGLVYESTEDYAACIKNFKKALEIDPIRADVALRLASIYVKTERLVEAVETLDAVILINPEIPNLYHLKFNILIQMNEVKKAEQTLDDAVSLFPDEMSFKFDKIELLISAGKREEAKKLLDDFDIENTADKDISRRVHMYYAQITAYSGDLKTTVDELEKAKAIFESDGGFDGENSLILMNCYVKTEQFEKVLDISRAFLSTGEDTAVGDTARYYEPFALKMLGRMDEALPLYKEAIEAYRNDSLAHPGFLDPYIMRSLCHKDIEEYDKAVELMEYVLKLKPDSEQAIAVMGSIKAEMKRGV